MDGRQFLVTARFLRNEGTDEAAYRSAVSRAYYACFLEARQLAFDNCPGEARAKAQIKNVRKIGHEPLQTYLKNSEIEGIRNLGEDLAGLCGNRQSADYDMKSPLSANDAQHAIDEAQALLDALKKANASQIGQAVKSHIDKTHK